MKHTNESIRKLIKRANDKGWIDEELNKQVIEADVSGVTDMSKLFYEMGEFDLDISAWDVSRVTNMSHIFYDAINFNQDISSWDVSKVNDMEAMFAFSRNFNQDISSWNVSSVTDMFCIFENTVNFDQDLTIWQALKDNLDITALNYCKELTSECIESYLSKKELELREELTKTGCLGLKKDVDKVTGYQLLSNFKELKDRLEAVDIKIPNKEI
jgi:surface protein